MTHNQSDERAHKTLAEDEISEDVMDTIAQEMRDEEEAQEQEVEQDIGVQQGQEDPQDEILDEVLDEDSELEDAEVTPEETQEVAEPKEFIEMNEAEQLQVLEAILFASAEPLSPKALHERLPDEADLNVLLPALQAQYEDRGINLTQVDGHWAFRTAAPIAQHLTVEKEVNKKMSRAMLETMAIIAYHQPLTRAEIENIRGVATHRGTLDTLMEMEWVKPGRRRETPGRPLTWVTTTKFLDHFQLEQVNDLPGLEDLKASGLLDKRPAIETIPDTGDLFESADQDADEMIEAAEQEQSKESDEQAYQDALSNDMISGSSDDDQDESY